MTRLPTYTPPAPAPTATATGQGIRLGITSPIAGTQVSGNVRVTGVAAGPKFRGYQLAYAPGTAPAAGAWLPVQPPQMQPTDPAGGELGRWQTGTLPPGTYTLRLMVVDIANVPYYDWVVVVVTR